jgi:hypothetical protein
MFYGGISEFFLLKLSHFPLLIQLSFHTPCPSEIHGLRTFQCLFHSIWDISWHDTMYGPGMGKEITVRKCRALGPQGEDREVYSK